MAAGGPDIDRAAELELVDAALLGDMEAFANLFERYRQPLYSLCLKRLGDHSLAEDIVQEVFVRAFISLPNSDHRKPIWPWLATIAVRMCIDLQRQRSLTNYSEDIEVAVDAAANRGATEGQTGSALDAVIAAEKRAELFQSLRVLPKRQRRVFLLYALDGWSCADIAAAEGISVGAVHLLLFRARRKMRSLRENGPLPAIVLPFSWLRWKFQRIEERIRNLLGVYGEGLSGYGAQAISLGILQVAMAAAISHPVEPSERSEPARPSGAVVTTVQSSAPKTPSSNVVVSSQYSIDFRKPVEQVAISLADRMINANENATPENSSIYSLAVSPNYESNRTILAAGSYMYRHVLFASHDGGASWKPQVSRLPFVEIKYGMVFSPGFPQDPRIFTLAELGLHQSDDGGEIFRTVSSTIFGWSIAISPSFGRGDSKVLIGGKTLIEYDADTGVTKPGSLVIPMSLRGYYPSLTFSPGYATDRTVFVSDDYQDGQTILYRCQESMCEEMRLPIRGPLTLRFSPRFVQDGLVYAFTPWQLLVSNDGARSFREIQLPPLPEWGSIKDVAIVWNSPDPAIFVPVGGDIFRSFDAGRSWSKKINIFGFGFYGAYKLIATPTGRLVASGGLACSEDGGETWAPRCTPEP